MRVSLFVFLLLLPLSATAAPGDSVETRLRLLEQRLESQKDDAKTEAGRVENRFLDRIGSLELTASQQNSHVDLGAPSAPGRLRKAGILLPLR